MPDAPAPRLRGLDLFRGAVVASMLFVNLASDMPRVPAVLKHAAAYSDTVTFADLVFPAFLFMVGVSLPLALLRRSHAGEAWWRSVLHVFTRTASLLLVGVVLEFHEPLDPVRTGLTKPAWLALFFVGMFALWHVRPRGLSPERARRLRVVRLMGFALIALLVVLFRDTDGQRLTTAWWGILGMIGWGYLAASIVLLASRGRPLSLHAALWAMLALYVGSRHGQLGFVPRWLSDHLDVGELFGSVAAIVMAGVIVGRDLVPGTPRPPRVQLARLLAFALLLGAAGLALRPLHGLSKIGTTESYALVSAALAAAGFAVTHWLFDGLGWSSARLWLLARAGENALVAYVITALWHTALALFGVAGLWFRYAYPFAKASAPLALANVAVAVLFYLLLVAGMARAGLRLQL